MTDQQRIARIEFVKKLLVANEFREIKELGRKIFSDLTYMKDIGFENYLVSFNDNFIMFGHNDKYENLSHDQSLKPLRDFVKLSNQE